MTLIEASADCCASRSLPRNPAMAARVPSAYPSFHPSPAARAIDTASSARRPASSARPVCKATSLRTLSAAAVQNSSPATRHSSSPSFAQDSAPAGSLDRASCARPTRAGPRTPGGTPGASRSRKESSHSPPSANEPRTIQHGRTPVQIRSPVSASASARHRLSTCHTLPASMSYLRNTSTLADHGAGICAIPIARLCSTTRQRVVAQPDAGRPRTCQRRPAAPPRTRGWCRAAGNGPARAPQARPRPATCPPARRSGRACPSAGRPSSEHTCSAISREKPTKTDNRRSSTCSLAVSSSWLQSIVARSVR